MSSLFYRLPIGVQRELGWCLRHVKSIAGWQHQKQLKTMFDRLDVEHQKQWIFDRVRHMVFHAQEQNPFYREFYREKGFNACDLQRFDDLVHIPIVNKEILRNAGDSWCRLSPGSRRSNTGGTSGSPLSFSVSATQCVRERFYIHCIWKRVGFRPQDNRAVFRGVNLGSKPWSYDPQQDAFFVNLYCGFDGHEVELRRLFEGRKIHYLHGYPSAISQFAKFCLRDENAELKQSVARHLKGILLGSEFPAPQYRQVIEAAFPVPGISWYGHTEKAVLAAENGVPFEYEPFQSYGFCEAIKMDDEFHLVGTAYDNFDSPFIRYDIGDSVLPVRMENGLMKSFEVKNGRLGDFILDRKGHPVSLTALIFGRHHKAFERTEFIQVSQAAPGVSVLHVTMQSDAPKDAVLTWFDLTNVDVDFDIHLRKKPFRTQAGKIPLLISSEHV